MTIAAGLLAIAFLFAVYNGYLSWVRPLCYRRKHGSIEGYRFVSGIPLAGTIFATLAVISAPTHAPVVALAIVTQLIDTGGLLWFVIAIWRE
jgi:hypothetical protein